jgi:NitT/TauT family transport system permease protein/sulfonate transport system permease protein
MAKDGRLWDAIWVTSKRIFWGFLFGAAAGFAIGFALGLSRLARAAFEPVMYGLWTIPKLAVLPLLLLIFGFGDMPVIMLVVLNTSFLVMIPTIAAVAGVPPEWREVARSFGLGRMRVLTKVVIPSILPDIFVALKIAAGASVLVVVAAEFVNGAQGLGYIIWNSWQVFLAKPMYVGIFTVAVLGAAFTLLIGAIGRRLAPWSEKL